jgi:hypothetical protein
MTRPTTTRAPLVGLVILVGVGVGLWGLLIYVVGVLVSWW